MTTPDTQKVAVVKPLEQQKSDFTSEGAPPPGMVAGTLPAPAENAAISAKEKELADARLVPLDHLTTNQGLRIADNHNSLKAGERGPTLLEDFILREKITHFDHERIPERVVHARGVGAHGEFLSYDDQSKLTKAKLFSAKRQSHAGFRAVQHSYPPEGLSRATP